MRWRRGREAAGGLDDAEAALRESKRELTDARRKREHTEDLDDEIDATLAEVTFFVDRRDRLAEAIHQALESRR